MPQAVEVSESTSKALPVRAKVAVVHAGASAEAWMDLPTASTRVAATQLPAVVWVTVGLLATDGFALQVRQNELAECIAWTSRGWES